MNLFLKRVGFALFLVLPMSCGSKVPTLEAEIFGTVLTRNSYSGRMEPVADGELCFQIDDFTFYIPIASGLYSAKLPSGSAVLTVTRMQNAYGYEIPVPETFSNPEKTPLKLEIKPEKQKYDIEVR